MVLNSIGIFVQIGRLLFGAKPDHTNKYDPESALSGP